MDTRRLASLALRLVSAVVGLYLVYFSVGRPSSRSLLVGFTILQSNDRLKGTRRRVVVYLLSAFLATSLPVVYLNVWSYRSDAHGLTHLDWYVPALILCLVVATVGELARYALFQTV